MTLCLQEIRMPLNARQNCSHIIRRTPPVLQDIQAQFPRTVNVWVKHLADKFDSRWFVGILLFKVHDQAEGSIFERRIRRSYNHSVPSFMYVSLLGAAVCTSRDAYQVITLSAMGDAETPAGGSVCIRCVQHLLALARNRLLFSFRRIIIACYV